MINNEILEKAKATSFVAHLSDEEIIKLLKDCGYSLDSHIFENSDFHRRPIERNYDSRNRKMIIEICGINNYKQNVMHAMARKIPILNYYNCHFEKYNTSLIIIKDYEMYDLFMQDKSPFQEKFVDFMYKKFGERYRIAYNKNATRQNNKLIKEQEIEK